ncbi:MAG: DNA recombination protein RmuC [Firmicutes bacterium]|nr:DNA recombination protein RmuC [Bacillota bacterium]
MEIIIIILLITVLALLVVVCMQLRAQKEEDREYNHQAQMERQKQFYELDASDQQTQKYFSNIQNQLQKMQIDQSKTHTNMEILQNNMTSMNQIMTNTKRRGNWGEYQLEHLLRVYAGENPKIFSMQYTLENGKIADAVFHLPNTEKILCIDSKFPMENYLKLMEKESDETLRIFRNNVKKHIDDISQKYINEQTTNVAILFLPSEAIYQYICGNIEELLTYALRKKVMITSPTTLVGVIFTLLDSTKDFYRAGHVEEIERNIVALQEDVERLAERAQKAEKSLESLANQFHSVSVSATKMNTRIHRMIEGSEEE